MLESIADILDKFLPLASAIAAGGGAITAFWSLARTRRKSLDDYKRRHGRDS